MSRCWCRAAVKTAMTALIIASASRPPSAAPAGNSPALPRHKLYLAVVINGVPANRVAEFIRTPDGRILATRAEFADIGIKGGSGGGDDLVELEKLDGLMARVDDVAQKIFIEARSDRLSPTRYDASGNVSPGPSITPSAGIPGAVLNYTLFATTGADTSDWFDASGHDPALSGALEGRVFGKFGVLSQSAIASTSRYGPGNAVRLDTQWSHANPATLRSVRAGDVITGGLSWTRPIRLGGAQVQRNFALRPDLVTLPVPEFSGSAAIPSSVEVFANNVRVFDKNVPAGPYVISNLPAVTGASTAQVVVRDALGRESVSELPFYTSPSQLREGLYDYSLEAGVPRRSYGARSADYDGGLSGSVSLRYGVSNSLTLESHAEVSANLLNAGVGAVFPLSRRGVMSLAGAASTVKDEGAGAMFAASLEAQFGEFTFHARTRRQFGGYADLAALSERRDVALAGPERYFARVPRAVDQAVLAIPLRFDPSRLVLSLTRIEDAAGARTSTLGAAWTRRVSETASFYATGFTGLEGEGNRALFAGLTFTLGGGKTGTLNLSSSRNGLSGGFGIAKPEQAHPGSIGWRLHAREGERPDRLASLSTRTGAARLRGTVQQYGERVRASAEAEGAVALVYGSAFLAPPIHDAFAVVDAGAPGVEVYRENRLMGKTGPNGKIIVPGLNAYEPSTFAISPRALPVDAEIARTREIIVPADRSAALVGFGIDTKASPARVIFRDPAGSPLPAGSSGQLEGSAEPFIIGYDGMAYLRRLDEAAVARVTMASGGMCTARVAPPVPGTARTRYTAVICR